LTNVEREELLSFIEKTRVSAKKSLTARILLKADAGDEGESWSNDKIAKAFEISVRSVVRFRKRFVEEGLEATLNRKAYPKTRHTKLDGEEEAHLIAICCGTPPSGRASLPLRLLADKLIALKIVDAVSHETIRKTLKKPSLNQGFARNGAFFPKLMPPLFVLWKIFWRFIGFHITLRSQWYVWTKAVNSSSKKPEFL
jgi:transposase